MKLIINLVLMALAIMIAAYLIPGVHIGGFWNALLAGFLISFVNTFIGGILRIFTFPVNILTFGLMSFIITVLMIMLVDAMMSTFSISSFWVTVLFAIVLAVIKTFFNSILSPKRY
jgi:putative membrane protein